MKEEAIPGDARLASAVAAGKAFQAGSIAADRDRLAADLHGTRGDASGLRRDCKGA